MESSRHINAILVDDEKAVRVALQKVLSEFPFITVVAEAANVPEAVREIQKHHPHLVFLDIEMPGYSGLQLLEFFNPQQVNFDIVFVTAFNEYAIRAFKLSAFDYLLKPVDKQELHQTLTRYLDGRHQERLTERMALLRQSLVQSEAPSQIAITSLQGIDFVQVTDLVALEASGTYTTLKTVHGETITSSKPLGEFEELLKKDTAFFRTHRSYLINIRHVRRLSSKDGDVIIMSNDMEVPLSRYRKKDFESLIQDFRI